MFKNFRILSLAVVFFLLAPGICSADKPEVAQNDPAADLREPEYKLKLRTTRFLVNLAAMPAYAWTEGVFHEGSHALWAAAQGHKILSFKPYPHFEELDGQRRFLLGFMSIEGTISKKEEVLILAGPTITDFTLFVAADLALTYGVDPNAWYAPIIFMAGILWPTIDWITTMNAWSPNTDIVRFCQASGTDRVVLTIVGDAMAAVAIWRIFHHGKNIFFEKEHLAGSPVVIVSPLVGGNITGLALAGTF